MSLAHSAHAGSSSSIATMTTLSPNDLAPDSSNILYEDRDHFQSIFTNDSRFFDTSLHLFKSYCSLGYIELENDEKPKKLHVPFLTTSSNGHKHRWRTRLLGIGYNNDNHHGPIKAFLTPTLLKKNDQSPRIRSDSEQKSPMIVQYQRPSVSAIKTSDSNKSDESDVTITRL